MDANRLTAWHEFFIMVGGAAAVLAGLLFVAISLHMSAITRNPYYQARGSATLWQLGVVIVWAGIGLIPEQPPTRVAIELALVGLVLMVMLTVTFAPHKVRAKMNAGAWARVLYSYSLGLIGLAGAATLYFDRLDGLLYYAGVMLAILTGSLFNCWAMLVGVSQRRL